jgi:flagellar FliL protein
MNQRGKLPIVIIAVALVVLLGGTGAFVMKSKGHSKEKKGEITGPVASLPLGEFLVNLADSPQMRYLKANIVIEVQGEVASGGGNGHGGGAETDPKVRDAVIQVLSSKHMADLTGAEGKEKLKEDIIKAVNARMEKAKVVEVFFNEFAMQ